MLTGAGLGIGGEQESPILFAAPLVPGTGEGCSMRVWVTCGQLPSSLRRW